MREAIEKASKSKIINYTSLSKGTYSDIDVLIIHIVECSEEELKKIASFTKNKKVILLLHSWEKELAKQMLKGGVDQIIFLPSSIDGVTKKIQEVIGQ